MGIHTNHVTVGIVGGSVAGLALARMLELAGISYCLWEAHREFAPAAGASLGLNPNGLRILDQLGLIDRIEEFEAVHERWEHRDSQGRLLASLTAQAEFRDRLGYGFWFMARQDVLGVLFDGIEDRSKLTASQRVVAIESEDQCAVIVGEDGRRVSCDIIAGADGVRSLVRQEIERRSLRVKTPISAFNASYSCIYGISNPVPNIGPGRAFTVYDSNASLLMMTGQDGSFYWFVHGNLERTIPFDKRKKFSHDDLHGLAAQAAEFTITDGVKFGDVFVRRRSAIMTALEEGIADPLYTGRMFLLGDSAHKMTPHAGMGANQALESAAAFVNELRPILEQDMSRLHIPLSDVQSCLERYAERRRDRVTAAMHIANLTCRVQLKIGPVAEKMYRLLPNMTNEMYLAKPLEMFSRAEKLQNWSVGSARVNEYDVKAEGILRGLQV